tara:strand:- start:6907 stop:7719 length:813 start_codon:yes stop_codon:yes gene_type:complete
MRSAGIYTYDTVKTNFWAPLEDCMKNFSAQEGSGGVPYRFILGSLDRTGRKHITANIPPRGWRIGQKNSMVAKGMLDAALYRTSPRTDCGWAMINNDVPNWGGVACPVNKYEIPAGSYDFMEQRGHCGHGSPYWLQHQPKNNAWNFGNAHCGSGRYMVGLAFTLWDGNDAMPKMNPISHWYTYDELGELESQCSTDGISSGMEMYVNQSSSSFWYQEDGIESGDHWWYTEMHKCKFTDFNGAWYSNILFRKPTLNLTQYGTYGQGLGPSY